MNPIMMRAVINMAMFFEITDDDVLDPDIAVAQMEQLFDVLGQLNPEDRAALVAFIDSILPEESDGRDGEKRAEALTGIRESLVELDADDGADDTE